MADKDAAKAFALEWQGKGDEKQDTQTFWISLLQRVFGVGKDNIAKVITFEVRSSKKQRGKDFKDAVIYRYNKENEILVEQKSFGIALDKKIKQSDGEELTPFEQAKRYDDQSVSSDKARWIITCNFNEFWIYDMEREGASLYDPVKKVMLSDLPSNLGSLSMLGSEEPEHAPDFENEIAVSVKAGELVGIMYDAFEKQYVHEQNGTLSTVRQQALNKLCVRIVFCLYAEDSGLFRDKQFHDYMESYQTSRMRRALIDLFDTLNTPIEQRDPYLEPDIAAFPYVNGGLFAGEIEVPNFTDDIRHILLDEESSRFDWSAISPTIFGAVFESTLNPETRRSGGMHYTSVQNIHKVIDPLFLDDLKAECDRLLSNASAMDKQLRAFQDKLASLTFLDPACGSGNFLTETYLSLRRLENRIIDKLNRGLMQFGNVVNPIKVSIQQFYGVEINDFAVSVAQTALWIAEHKMFKETEKILNMNVDFLPLKTFTHIHEGNALSMNWNEIVPAENLNYIMGNPPFVGKKYQTHIQKTDMKNVFGAKTRGVGNLDYVCAWYKKACEYMLLNTQVKVSFVSTNSITQGEHIPLFWKNLYESYPITIRFAYKTFIWNSEAYNNAAVHCVIIGFSLCDDKTPKVIYELGKRTIAKNIHPYLIDMPNIFIENRAVPIDSSATPLVYGSFALDDGQFTISEEEYSELLKKEPDIQKYLKLFIGSNEFINNEKRYCIWLKGAPIHDIKSSRILMKKISHVRDWRTSSNRKETVEAAKTPTLFAEIRQPDSDYLAIPITSSQRREYIPIGYMSKEIIASNHLLVLPGADIYQFGILTSAVHMGWMRTVAGRLKSDYNYSARIVYNNFPWPSPTALQKQQIEKTAQVILDARAMYSDSSLADLYDPLTMPIELRKAHDANDEAVMDAYGFSRSMTEPEIVSALMKMYQALVDANQKA
jgi:type I restriction-modification system DNA methylase subunit